MAPAPTEQSLEAGRDQIAGAPSYPQIIARAEHIVGA